MHQRVPASLDPHFSSVLCKKGGAGLLRAALVEVKASQAEADFLNGMIYRGAGLLNLYRAIECYTPT
jgi:hypothetical protein